MYSPKVTPDYIRALYRLKLIRKKPMTKLIDEAVKEYLLKHGMIQQGGCNEKE
jgi:hypothetical protein